jgi:hypothetical protein
MKHQVPGASPDYVYRTVHQSVDYAIKELLEAADDPLALASYLWTFRQHRFSSVRSDGLVRWGEAWARRVFVERQVGQRRDEEIASAALCVIALKGTRSLSALNEDISRGVHELLSTELDRRAVPFRRPSYAAMLLLAAHVLNVNEPRVRTAAREVGKAYKAMMPGGRVFGLTFCVRLLLAIDDGDQLDDLVKDVRAALTDPGTSYEDNVYLLQALWQMPDVAEHAEQTLTITEQIVATSPAWAYLMVGVEDIPSAGDGRAVVKVSHLFRSALLDVTARYQVAAARRHQARQDARLQGRRGVSLLAYGSPLLFFIIVWGAYLYFMIPALDAGGRFWLAGGDSAMRPATALLFLGGVALLPYLLIITPIVLVKLYQILIRGNIQSDQRIIHALWKPTWKITAGWLTLVVLAAVINLATGVLGPRLQHIIDVLVGK